jgi:hypothetical protein
MFCEEVQKVTVVVVIQFNTQVQMHLKTDEDVGGDTELIEHTVVDLFLLNLGNSVFSGKCATVSHFINGRILSHATRALLTAIKGSDGRRASNCISIGHGSDS